MFLKFDTILVTFIYKTLFKYTTHISKYLQIVSLGYQIPSITKDSISIFNNIFKHTLSFWISVNDTLTKNKIKTILSQRWPRIVTRMFHETASDESIIAF